MVVKAVRVFWFLVAPKLKDRPEACPRTRLPAPAEDAETTQALRVVPRQQAPRVEGPHRRCLQHVRPMPGL
eukprot:2436209-Amphidinium_carterae.1